ncbi:MAG: DNA-directed RNA polymerase subunit alpha [bacterium]
MLQATSMKEKETNPRIIIARDDKREGKFFIYPLEKGIGHTIGSALRRVLLSQIPGAAITEARIEGVYHPLTTLENVKEDVTLILLNLKEVAIRVLRPFTGALTMRLDVQGEGEVLAADIKTPPELEIANPEQHIATLTDPNAKLRIDMKVEMGKGFRLADMREGRYPIGSLPLTAIFTPIRRVAYYVDAYYFIDWEEGQNYLGKLAIATQLQEKLELERLTMEITTNGAITPSEALLEAAAILSKYFQITPFGEEVNEPVVTATQAPNDKANDPVDEEIDKELKEREALLDLPLEELDLPSRAYNALRKEGITTLRELCKHSEKQLLNLRNLGKKTIDQLKAIIAEMGFSLAADEEERK